MRVSEESFTSVLALVVAGVSVRTAIKQSGVPSSSWYHDLAQDGDEPAARREQYARAIQESIRAVAEYTADLADSAMDARDNTHVQGIRLAVETRKWLLSKLAPKVYGDKVDVSHQGNVTLQLSKDDAAL